MASKLYHSNLLEKELEWLEKEIAKEIEIEEKVESQTKTGYHVDPNTGKIVRVEPERKVLKKIKKIKPRRRVVKRIRIKKAKALNSPLILGKE
jgi:hypothetical protein